MEFRNRKLKRDKNFASGLTWFAVAFALIAFLLCPSADAQSRDSHFQETILPILKTYCFDCHSGDAKEGDVQLDSEDQAALLGDKAFWLKVLRNVRSDMMPPRDSQQPTKETKRVLADWIHTDVFEIHSKDPFPGTAPLRRLNRTEYRNTIRDLMGVDFNAEVIFPPDDTGFGFDNVSEAMSLSPMLIEKYLQAAKSIVVEAVPKAAWIMPSMQWKGTEFLSEDFLQNGIGMRHNRPLTVQKSFEIKHAGEYRLIVKEKLHGSFDFHPGRYQITCLLDGMELYSAEYKWEENKVINNAFVFALAPGSHSISIRLSAVKIDEKDEADVKDRYVSY